MKRVFKYKGVNAIRPYILILVGVALVTFGLKAFLLNHGLVAGGVMGASLLITEVSQFHLAGLIVILNLPFALLSMNLVGRTFAFRSVLAVSMLALGLVLFDFPSITEDMWLISVFGGFAVGAGMGLVIRGGGIVDGTEILALYLSRRNSFSANDIHLVLNIILFSVAAWLLDIEIALYSILTYISSTKTAEYFVEGIEEYVGVTIVTEHHEYMRNMIIDKLGRGVTLYHGIMGYGKRGQITKDTQIIYTVITRLEITKLQQEINKIDADAFVAMGGVLETRGGMIKKRPIPKELETKG